MNEFGIWFGTGMEHILDLAGYDHILYVTLLTLAFPPRDWRKLLLLITAFTLGHSVSLALSATNTIRVSQPFVELCIALSILITAGQQLFSYYRPRTLRDDSGNFNSSNIFIYCVTLLFGLVHGLGFSFLLKAMLGQSESVFWPLLYFNLGLECGQIIIVGVILLFYLFLSLTFNWKFKLYKLFLVCFIALTALWLVVLRSWELLQSS